MDELVGQNIKKFRNLRGVKQGPLADRVGVSLSYLSRIETGKRSADVRLLAKLAAELKIKVVDFFSEDILEQWREGVGEPGSVYYSLPAHLSEEERTRLREAIAGLGKIDPGDREMALELLTSIYRRSDRR